MSPRGGLKGKGSFSSLGEEEAETCTLVVTTNRSSVEVEDHV